jgi:hypothetical protein
MAVQTKENLKVRSGNRIAILLGGARVGLLQNVSASDDYSPEPASGIGDIHAVEYVPTMARHSLNVSSMMLRKGALLEAGAAVENGDAMLKGLVFDIEVYAADDATLLRKYTGCSYASGSLEVSKHAIVMQSGVFNALDVSGTAA